MRSVLAVLLFVASAASAEEATYGQIELTGLSRDNSWPFNPEGETFAMVCNVNGPDGVLSVRSGPGSDFAIERSLKRLAILTVDTGQRQGHWIRVLAAHREVSEDGKPLTGGFKALPVEGWAHDGYLCGFLD
jgi:hypothetical protein